MPPLSLNFIFNPSSIAVIGASTREQTVGHAVFKNLLAGGYRGALYPVNPNAPSVDGVKAYPNILDIGGPVDLAVIIVPADNVLSVFQDCARKKVKGAVVISAGFKEIGKEGAALEKELAEQAAKHRIPLIGPNCLGVMNTDPAVAMNASFARCAPRRGNIAFVSQSGALCTAVLDYAKEANIGFSKFISMGNKAVVTELELLEYLQKDEQTDVIMMYLEDLANPRKMIDLCSQISGDEKHLKPILAIKSGRTLQGARAACSHTGSLAGSDEVVNAIFAQGGILRVDTVEELFDYAKAFSGRRLPRGNRAAIVTNAGGPGIMATDACVRYGLQMAALSEKTQKELKKRLPPTANVKNPVDVIGDAQHDRYETALTAALQDKNVDGVILILTPQAMTDIENIAETAGKIAAASAKPVLACFMGIYDVSAGVKILEKWNLPHYRFPESAAKALAGMAQYTAWVKRPRTPVRRFKTNSREARRILRQAQRQGRTNLTEIEATAILKCYGFPTLPIELAKNPAQAGKIADRMGYPVVLKISSPAILHKIDVGGVRLNLKSRAETEKAAAAMLAAVKKNCPKAKILGLAVQKMAGKGREVILGLKRDPQFGPLLMFGLGGSYVEVMKDVTFRIAPIKELGAHNMIHSIRTFPILEGVRGEKPADLAKIEECLERLSQLALECPEISELDINPLLAYDKGKGCAVLDARILLHCQ